MAVSAVSLAGGGNGADVASYTIPAVAANGGRVLLLGLVQAESGTVTTPTVTGLGATWTRVVGPTQTGNSSSTAFRFLLFRATVPTTVTGDITVDFGGVAQRGLSWTVTELTGAESASGASGLVVQSVFASATAATAVSATLAEFAAPGNATFAITFVNSSGAALTPGAGFTALGRGSHTTPSHATSAQFADSPDTTVDVSTTAAQTLGIYAFELRAGFVVKNVSGSIASTLPALGSTAFARAAGERHTIGPSLASTSIIGPFDGELVPVNAYSYNPIFSTPTDVYVTAALTRGGVEQTRLVRIGLVGGSIAGRPPAQDVQVQVSPPRDAFNGHNGASVAVNSLGDVVTHPQQHGFPWNGFHATGSDLTTLVETPQELASGAAYVKLFRDPNTDDLWTLYRGPGTFDGMQLHKWNATTNLWDPAIFTVSRSTASGDWYAGQGALAFGPGVIYMTWNYEEPDPVPQHRSTPHVIRSLDNGVTWQTMSGAAVSNPATQAKVPPAWEDDGENANLLSQPSITVLPDGSPFLIDQRADSRFGVTTHQLWIARYVEDHWEARRLHDGPAGFVTGTYLAGQLAVLGILNGTDVTGWFSTDTGVTYTRRKLATLTTAGSSVDLDRGDCLSQGQLRFMVTRQTSSGGDTSRHSLFEVAAPIAAQPAVGMPAVGGTIAAVGGTFGYVRGAAP